MGTRSGDIGVGTRVWGHGGGDTGTRRALRNVPARIILFTNLLSLHALKFDEFSSRIIR